MKAYSILTAGALASLLVSCGGANTEGESQAVDSTAVVQSSNWTIDAEKSTLHWEGTTSGASVYSHFGLIKITDGMLVTEGDAVKSGKFTVDMNTIQPKDENYSPDGPAEKLVAHLTTPDFFDVANHPVSSFEITTVEGTTANGNLTVRGTTHPEAATIESVTTNADGTLTVKGSLVFDRQKYGVAWVHFMKDVLLADDIVLNFEVVAKKA